MSNKDFIRYWVLNPDTNYERKNGNLSSINGKLYSYNTCICQYSRNIYIVNVTKYSPTTSRHQNYLYHYLDAYSKHIIKVDNVIRNKVKLFEDRH